MQIIEKLFVNVSHFFVINRLRIIWISNSSPWCDQGQRKLQLVLMMMMILFQNSNLYQKKLLKYKWKTFNSFNKIVRLNNACDFHCTIWHYISETKLLLTFGLLTEKLTVIIDHTFSYFSDPYWMLGSWLLENREISCSYC